MEEIEGFYSRKWHPYEVNPRALLQVRADGERLTQLPAKEFRARLRDSLQAKTRRLLVLTHGFNTPQAAALSLQAAAQDAFPECCILLHLWAAGESAAAYQAANDNINRSADLFGRALKPLLDLVSH